MNHHCLWDLNESDSPTLVSLTRSPRVVDVTFAVIFAAVIILAKPLNIKTCHCEQIPRMARLAVRITKSIR